MTIAPGARPAATSSPWRRTTAGGFLHLLCQNNRALQWLQASSPAARLQALPSCLFSASLSALTTHSSSKVYCNLAQFMGAEAGCSLQHTPSTCVLIYNVPTHRPPLAIMG